MADTTLHWAMFEYRYLICDKNTFTNIKLSLLSTTSNIHRNFKDQQHRNFLRSKMKTKVTRRRKRMRKANCVAKKSDIFVVGHSCLGNRHSSDGSELQMRRWSCVVLPSHALCRTVDPLLWEVATLWQIQYRSWHAHFFRTNQHYLFILTL